MTADNEWDYEEALFERYGMVLTQIVNFGYREAIDITKGSRIESQELVHDFVVNRLLKGPFPPERPDNPRGYLRRSLANHHIDMLRRRLPLPIPDLVESGMKAVVAQPDVDNFVARAWFWAIVEDCRFPAKCRRAIKLRLDRETFARRGTWDEIAANWGEVSEDGHINAAGPGCSRHTAQRRFEQGMRIVRRVYENDDWTDDEGQEEQ